MNTAAKAVAVHGFARLQKELHSGNIRPNARDLQTKEQATDGAKLDPQNGKGGQAYDLLELSPDEKAGHAQVGSPSGELTGVKVVE